jgi:hypothetical protein
MRSPPEAAPFLLGLQKADIALQGAPDNSPLIPGYDAACLERQEPTHCRRSSFLRKRPV